MPTLRRSEAKALRVPGVLGRRHTPGSNPLRGLRPLSAVAAVTAAALLLSGCGDASGSKGGGSGEAAAGTEDQSNPVDRDKLTDGGVLRCALDEIPPTLLYNQPDRVRDATNKV